MRRAYVGLGGAVLLCTQYAFGAGSDPAAARAQLQQGYALKQKGKCEEAIPYFVESVRLDRQPKALLNLADCEEKLHRLAAAQTHLVETRDLARSLGLPPYEKAAQERLAVLEKIIPKLAITLARDAPRDTVVARDGVELSPLSLSTPLPIDPGQHTVVARAATLERTYDVVLSEGETKQLEVTPVGGKSTAPPAAVSVATAPAVAPPGQEAEGNSAATSASPSSLAGVEQPTADRSPHTLRVLSYVSLGVGALALGAGGYFLYRRGSKEGESDDLFDVCNPRFCDEGERARVNELDGQAQSAQTGANIAFALGGVAIASGVTMLVLDASRSASAKGLTVHPWFGAGGGVWGTF